MDRRDFLKTTAAALAAGQMALGQDGAPAPATLPATMPQQVRRGEMIYRMLGRTGAEVSAIGLGGYHIGNPQEQEAIRLIRKAIDRGITFMDNCWDYHNGDSEARMGKALADGYRDKVFLMSKIDGRTKQAAGKQIDESLQRLKTDRIDLMQFHEVLRLEDPDRIFAEGGGMEAMQAAQKAGKVRFIGFTGHKDPLVHLRMLDVAAAHGFRFDAVQMPINVMDAHFRSFLHQVVPRLVREQIGVLGMKPLANGAIPRSNTATAIECLRFALSQPTSVVINGIDSDKLLDQAFEAVKDFEPMTVEQVKDLLGRTAQAAATGKYELFKTSSQYDGTAHNPQWLG